MQTLQEITDFFLHLMQCNIVLDLIRTDETLQRIEKVYTQRSENNFDLFLRTTSPERILRYCGRGSFHPVLVFGKLSAGWAVIPYIDEADILSYFLLGPCFTSVTSEFMLRRNLSALLLGPSEEKELYHLLSNIPICSVQNLQILAKQLYYCLTSEVLPRDDFLQIGSDSTNMLAVRHISEPNQLPHSPYLIEKMIFDAVERGESTDRALANASTEGYSLMPETGDPLRDAKNTAYTTNVLGSRAAIRGGVPPENAYAISDMFIHLIEQQTSPSDAISMSSRIIDEYTRVVRQYRDSGYSFVVKEAVSFMRTHIYEKISLDTVAIALGYNKNYLSTLFKKETGQTIGNYITQAKIRHAKNMLITERYTVAEISHRLCYASESHFSHVFKKVTGMTPTEYSNQRKVNEKQ